MNVCCLVGCLFVLVFYCLKAFLIQAVTAGAGCSDSILMLVVAFVSSDTGAGAVSSDSAVFADPASRLALLLLLKGAP